MIQDKLAIQLWFAVRRHWPVLLAVLPGLIGCALHSTMLVVPQADFIDALDSDRYRIQWITGAYIVGTSAGMSMTRFVGSRLGLRGAYLLGVACFTIAGVGCATIDEIFWMTPVRLVQGYGHGLMISVGMVILWREFHVHKALAMALYGMAIYVPAVAGASLGGLLTALHSWRLIFVLILPLGCVAGFAAWRGLPADRHRETQPVPFDPIGFVLLLSWIATMSVVLDMGQYWGWLASPAFVPWFVAFVLCFAGFASWGFFAPRPLINLRALEHPNFALGVGIKALYSVNVLVLLALLSNYMVNLRGYQWWQASLVIAPALATMILSALVGLATGTHRNRKLRLFGGLAVMAGATAAFSSLDLYTAKGLQAAYMAVWGLGAGIVIGPALLTAFEGLDTEQTLRTAGVFNILRALPAFAAGSVLTILLTRGTDGQFDVLRQNIRYNRPVVESSFRHPQGYFIEQGSRSHPTAAKQAHAALGQWVHANSRAFAFQAIFQYLALAPLAAMLLVLLIRVPKAADSAGQP